MYFFSIAGVFFSLNTSRSPMRERVYTFLRVLLDLYEYNMNNRKSLKNFLAEKLDSVSLLHFR